MNQSAEIARPGGRSGSRLESIDLLRGLVIVIMALDHTRDFWSATVFSPEDLTQASPGLFMTRWITHLCAPVFVFLAGVSAGLFGHKGASRSALARFLLSRGAWLIVLELAIIVPSWQWGWNFLLVQVIWVLGWSMILLAGLIFLPRWAIAVVAVTIVAGHNAVDAVQPAALGSAAWSWNLLHVVGWIPLSAGFGVWVQYPLLPWPALMALGYLATPLFLRPGGTRILLVMGVGAIALFVLLRVAGVYGDPNPWEAQPRGALFTTLDFFNTTKYPPSLQFLLMTLGPALLLLVALDRTRGWLRHGLLVFGRVPLFFYLLHVPLIHLGSTVYNYLAYGTDFSFITSPPASWPEAHVPRLWLAYLVWIAVVALLYWPCRRYGHYKFTHRRPWMSYL